MNTYDAIGRLRDRARSQAGARLMVRCIRCWRRSPLPDELRSSDVANKIVRCTACGARQRVSVVQLVHQDKRYADDQG